MQQQQQISSQGAEELQEFNKALLYKEQVDHAFSAGLISAAQYQHAMNQRHWAQQNQAKGLRRHQRKSSTGGGMETNSTNMILTNGSSLQQPQDMPNEQQHAQLHQPIQGHRPSIVHDNRQITEFQLSNMASNLNAQLNGVSQQHQNQLQSTAELQHTLSQYNFGQIDDESRQHASSRTLVGQQAKTHRVQSVSGSNSSAMYRYSNLQNFNIKQRQINTGNENSEVKPKQPQTNMSSRHSFQQPIACNYNQIRNAQSQTRADSAGPAPAVHSNGGLHSSGGSIGTYSYRRESGMMRSRTQNNVNMMSNIIGMITCPCHQKNQNQRSQSQAFRSTIKAHLGSKQPILQSTETTANCGQCGQFYAIKDNHYTNVSQSGKKQIGSQAMIIKTVRERDISFKLDDPVSEIFSRMRQVSLKVIENLQPHPFYLQKRVKRIDNLSYIADALTSDNQTIHHAVLLMDIYSSKVSKNQDYDTLLISLCCLLISAKFHQIKYPGADTLNDMVKRKYSADLIIHMEGVVLEVIDWNLMVYSIYDYVKLFISQGCLFDNEEILKQAQDDILDDSTVRERPGIKLAEHFKKYAEFFADFCMYQECFMTNDPYLLACAIVAYTRKYMCVAIIWPTELELLTQCNFNNFKNLYLIIESKYTESFPSHARSQNIRHQLVTEPHQQTAQASMRKNVMNQNLQLSSGGKTQKTQNSSNKPGAFNNILSDLKTPDKFVFDFNSIVSGNKTQEKFSHEKFQINSNSVEKFRLQNNITKPKPVTSDQTSKVQGVIFSDNKKQSINAQSFKKMIMKNQTNTTLSDEKQTQVHQSLLKNYHDGMQNKREMAKIQPSDKRGEYLSQNNHTQNASVGVTSPSANIIETENEQEVPPFKPMIMKSNSQAIGGGFECKTTTKKSPSGAELEKINALKEAMTHVNIQAKMPSSTTNKSMKLHIHGSLAEPGAKNGGNIFSNKNITTSYGAIGVNNGPIKINQKIKVVNGSNQKSSQHTGQKSQGMTSSSKKMKVSKTYATQIQGTNLSNQYYQDRLAEQREQRQKQNMLEAVRKSDNRHPSCVSQNQKISNPNKNYSYISGKPKTLGAQTYEKNTSSQGIASEGSANHYGNNNQIPQRSVLSIKNAAHVIKRKSSYHHNQQQAVELRVNIKQNSQQKHTLPSNAHVVPQNMAKGGKNLPNGLLRKATDGTQGKQKSIGALSNYMGGATAATAHQINGQLQQTNQDAVSLERTNPNNHMMSYDSEEHHEKERHHTSIHQDTKGQTNSSFAYSVNPPAIITVSGKIQQQQAAGTRQATLVKNQSFTLGNGQRDSNDGSLALGGSKSAFLRMNQERQSLPGSSGATHRSSNNHTAQNYASMPGASGPEQNPDYSNYDDISKQMKKNNSQMFGKARQRPKVTRGQMLKDLNDKKDKMSQLVEAAHATRCTSNEKGSSTKKNGFEAFGSSVNQQKYINSTGQPRGSFANPAPLVSSFNLMAGGSNSHSREREGQFASSSLANNENFNAMNMNSQSNAQKPNFISQSISHKGQMGQQRQSFLSQHSSQMKQQQMNSQKLTSFRV